MPLDTRVAMPVTNERDVDALVIGAGPAGAAAAAVLGRAGRRVLLVDKAARGRPKVCGGCLGAESVRSLAELDFVQGLDDAGAPPITRVGIAASGSTVVLPIEPGRAITRTTLDERCAQHAAVLGAEVRWETRARVEDADGAGRLVELSCSGSSSTVRAGVVIVCDGLSGTALAENVRTGASPEPTGPIGLGTVVQGGAGATREGTIEMHIGRGGYVGAVAAEDDQLVLAAALKPSAVRRGGGAAGACAAVLAGAGAGELAELARAARWSGTPRLRRRRRRVVAERLLIAGDAGGYVEPFTGEGIAWALSAGTAAASLVLDAGPDWGSQVERAWSAFDARVLGVRRRRCRMITRVLHCPPARTAVVRLASAWPAISARAARSITRPRPAARVACLSEAGA
jgi:flavin-dependent dehydrogenase